MLRCLLLAVTLIHPALSGPIQFVIRTEPIGNGGAQPGNPYASFDAHDAALSLPIPAPNEHTYITLTISDWPGQGVELTMEGMFAVPAAHTLVYQACSIPGCYVPFAFGGTAAGTGPQDTFFARDWFTFAPWFAAPYSHDSLYQALTDLMVNGSNLRFRHDIWMEVNGSYIGALEWDGMAQIVSVTELPEPSSVAMLLLGAAVAVLSRQWLRSTGRHASIRFPVQRDSQQRVSDRGHTAHKTK